MASPHPRETALRYDRSAELEGEDSLSAIARLIAPESTVLDLGAATGKLGLYLRDRKRCAVDGVEIDTEAAALARPNYRKLFQLDLESAELKEHFPAGAYDAIVCADVIEHLRNPDRIVAQLPALLKEGGRILFSVPNIGYAGVLAALLNGEFKYREIGLLDETHLRFFTRRSLVEMLARHGLHARSITPLTLNVQDSEFSDQHLDTLPPAVLTALIAQPDALTYQFIVDAAPGPTTVTVAALPPRVEVRFQAQLFWSSGGSFDEARSAYAAGVLGADRQRLELRIPPLPSAPTRLRLDPTDRPGFIRIHAIELHDADGEKIWEWDGLPIGLGAVQQLVDFVGLSQRTFLCTGSDPSLELPVLAPALARIAQGGLLALDIGWPMSPDFAIASRVLEERQQGWQAERAALLDQIAPLRAGIEQHRAALARLTEQIPQLRSAIELERKEAGEGISALRIEQSHASEQSAALRAEQANLVQQLSRMSDRLQAFERGSLLQRALRRLRKEILPKRLDFEALPMQPDAFELKPIDGCYPSGWVGVHFEFETEHPEMFSPRLWLDVGSGYREQDALPLPPPRGGAIRGTVRLPQGLAAIRLNPNGGVTKFRLGRLTMRELGKVRAGQRLMASVVRDLLGDPLRIPGALAKAWSILRAEGPRGLKRSLIERHSIR